MQRKSLIFKSIALYIAPQYRHPWANFSSIYKFPPLFFSNLKSPYIVLRILIDPFQKFVSVSYERNQQLSLREFSRDIYLHHCRRMFRGIANAVEKISQMNRTIYSRTCIENRKIAVDQHSAVIADVD